MTERTRLEARAAAYDRRASQLTLRAAVLDAAEKSGVRPEDPLPEPLQRAYDAYTREIDKLNGEITGLDREIANEENR